MTKNIESRNYGIESSFISREVRNLHELPALGSGAGGQFGNARPQRGILHGDVGPFATEQLRYKTLVHEVVHHVLYAQLRAFLNILPGLLIPEAMDKGFGFASREQTALVGLDWVMHPCASGTFRPSHI